jgi:hypothetical protein
VNVFRRGTTKDGTPIWRLRWEVRDPGTGKRRFYYETFHGTKRAAERRWTERQAEIQAQGPGYREPARITLKAYLDDWLAHKEPNLRPTTFRNYQDLCRLYIVPHLGAMPLKDLTAPMLQAWITDLRTRVGTVTVASSSA